MQLIFTTVIVLATLSDTTDSGDLLSELAGVAQGLLPRGSIVSGSTTIEAGRLLAQSRAEVQVPIPPEAGGLAIRCTTGCDPAGLSVALRTDGGNSTELAFRPRDISLRIGAAPDAIRSLSDACIELPWRARLFVRPNVEFYKDPRRREVLRKWGALPTASDHLLTIELRRGPAAWQAWIDGRFVQEFPVKGRPTKCDVRLPPGGSFNGVSFAKPCDAKFLPLAIGCLARPGAMAAGTVTLAPGEAAADAVPLRAVAAAENIDVDSLGRVLCASDDLVSFYWRRGALDGLPESCIVSVPLDTYCAAYVLCAAEDDLAKTPAFTLRMTRYGNSRGDAMADTLVRLPEKDSKPDLNVRQVGTVTYGPPVARKTVPLWRIRVPLKPGLIQDLLQDDRRKNNLFPTHRYLDIELMDPLAGVEENDAFPPSMRPTGRTYSPRGPRSAVHVFAMTLEASPAGLTVRPNTPVSMFYASDNPELRATVDARQPGTYTVAWDFADVEGRIVATGKKSLTLSAEKPGDSVAVPVAVGNGWYATRFRLLDTAGCELVDYRGSMVMLPPDTRRAGFESPHGTWWFHWAHGGEPNIARVGPMLQRAGLRHTILPETLPETLTAPYGVTAWCVNWYRSKTTDATVVQKIAEHEEHIRKTLKLWPSVDKLLVWHESGASGAPFPSELWGEEPKPLDEESAAAWKYRMEYVSLLAKMVREKFPKLKLQFGNDGSSLGIIAGLLRNKFPREYCDFFAVEDAGQTFITEKAVPGGLQSAWYLRQTARKLGYGDVPITACYEWIGRRDLALGFGPQAEWYARDALHARAYGFQTIAQGGVHDAGAGYFHTIWGGGGLCRRYPAMDPKPAYAAVATLTRVLDSARFQRALPTGSLTLYALEFRRDDQRIYAVWVPRGRREATLRFIAPAERTVIDLYGRESTSQGQELKLTASTAAQYIVTKTRLESVSAGRTWFPHDPPPKQMFIADRMDSLKTWIVEDEKDKRLERTTGENMPHRTKGRFEVREVHDAEKGDCLEVELKPEGQIWEAMHEYVVLRPRQPVVAPGPYEHAGIWLKGNSGWGEVMWEIQDAKGAKWLSQHIWMDWPGHIAANFDGWNFLRLPLQAGDHWRSQIKITGLVITVPRKMLYLTEMVPVPELKVRLKEVGLF